MRVIVISDMEGVGGICRWEQVVAPGTLYDEGRVLYTEEINAAVGGAFAAGAEEVLVMDCHGAGSGFSFNSLVPELLDQRCEWIVQSRWTQYTEALERGRDAALLIGMHARAGLKDGVLNHTVSSQEWREVRFNGTPVGEVGITAAVCGTWDCPVVLVTGDQVTCREARELLGSELDTVQVKHGFGQLSARMIHPARARKMIRQGAETALGRIGVVSPYRPDTPCRIEVDLNNSLLAEPFADFPGVEIADGRTIVSKADTWWGAWRQFFREDA